MSFFIQLFYSISLFGFIFSIALLIRKKPLPYYFFIGVYLIFTFSLFVNIIISTNLIGKVPHLYRVISPLHFLLGPLCYFFIRATLRPYLRMDKRDALHFIPFILATVGLIPFFMLPGDEKLRMMASNGDLVAAWQNPDTFGITYVMALRLKFFIFFFYLFFQWKLIHDFFKNASRDLHQNNKRLLVWLIFDSSLKSTIGLLVFISTWFETAAAVATLLQFSLISIEVIGSAFFLIASPELMAGMVFQDGNIGKRRKHSLQQEVESQENTIIINNQDDDNDLKNVLVRTEQYLQLNQPFLDPAFGLTDLSAALNLPTRQVSQAIKLGLGMGFPEYINKVRFVYLEEQLVQNPEMLQFSVDAMAKMVGFSSRSGFYKAFKKMDAYESPAQMIEKIKSGLVIKTS